MIQDYDLELDRVADKIKQENVKTVLIQLADGLKPRVKEIKQELEKKIGRGIKLLFWAGSCFGACDVPLETKRIGVDLIVQFGHSEWQ